MSIAGEGLNFLPKFEPENIPEELKDEASWVCWKYEKRNGKTTKNLYKTNRHQAKSDDPSTWTTFNKAIEAVNRDSWFDGVGFVFHDGNPYAGADLDKVTEEQARGWIERFDSYTERSPSRDGFHIICKAELPQGTKRDAGELYSSGRFFTMTGDVVRDLPIAERQATAEEFYRFLRKDDKNQSATTTPTGVSSATDEQVLEKLLHETTGKGRRLFAGDTTGYSSPSEADQAFMNKLYWLTQDLDQIDRIWQRSGLMRDKWKRADYRRRTYMKASNLITETYDWNQVTPSPTNSTNSAYPTNSANSANSSIMSAVELLEMEMQPTRWVVPDVLPEGLTLLVGKPKKGKSWMGLGVCEAVAAGGVAFGVKKVEKGESLYMALEDNPRRLQKRLKKVLSGHAAPEGLHITTEWPRLEEGGAEGLDRWLAEHPNAHLVVIDTLAKIRKPATGKNIYNEDYTALETLLPIAARYGVAIVVVHHLRKGEATDPQDMISGSTGLAGGVDGWMILHRAPGSSGPTLYVDGRDIEEPAEYALHWNFNTATWTIEGTAEEVHLSKERADILLVLNRSPEPMSPKEVADLLPGRKHNNVKYLMHTMLGDDQLVKVGTGKYEPATRTRPVSGLAGGTRSANCSNPHRTAESTSSVSGVSRVSGDGKEEPLSSSLSPGESATLEELREGPGHPPKCMCEDCLPI